MTKDPCILGPNVRRPFPSRSPTTPTSASSSPPPSPISATTPTIGSSVSSPHGFLGQPFNSIVILTLDINAVSGGSTPFDLVLCIVINATATNITAATTIARADLSADSVDPRRFRRGHRSIQLRPTIIVRCCTHPSPTLYHFGRLIKERRSSDDSSNDSENSNNDVDFRGGVSRRIKKKTRLRASELEDRIGGRGEKWMRA